MDSGKAAMDLCPTRLLYYDQMFLLQSSAALLSFFKGDDGKRALLLDSTIFHPQGGGQPADTGFIAIPESDIKFRVQDVRSKDGVVFHYGFIENSNEESESKFEIGKEVFLQVDESRRKLNSRENFGLGGVKYKDLIPYWRPVTMSAKPSDLDWLHSAGHLLDICMQNLGLGNLEPVKGYHFPDGPCVEYKGVVPQNELQGKQRELELNANALISIGGKVSVVVLPYSEAAELCGGGLPDYIPKGSNPRIVKIMDRPGCPCGGTHVSDISEIISVKVTQIRTKKGVTKINYSIGS